MLKYQINRNNVFSDQLRINYTSFSVEDIDYIDNTKCLVKCFYNDDIDIKENDYVVAVYDEPTMNEFNMVSTKSKFREYKVEGVNEDDRFFTLISEKYCELKGTYLSNETVTTYVDKIIEKSGYDNISDPEEKLNYSINQYKWKKDSLISIGEYNAIENDFEKDAYVDCYTNGSDYISMWERFGSKEYGIDSEGNVTETDPYIGYGSNPDGVHKILNPYVSVYIDVETYNSLNEREKECYEVDSYIFPGGKSVETSYLYVWLSTLHYFKDTDAYPPEIEIDCDDITYTLSNGEIVNDFGLRFLQDEITEAIYDFFKNNNFYPVQKYIEPVEGTEFEDWEYNYSENLDYFIARIDEARIRRRDIVFPPQPSQEDEVETEPSSSDDTNVILYLKKHLTTISVPLTNEFSTDMYQDYNIKEKFIDVETKKAINGFVEMEKDVYHPVAVELETVNGIQRIKKLQKVKEIRFNLHFREHRDEEWTAQPDSFWNGTYTGEDGILHLMNYSNNNVYGFFGYNDKSKQSDLLTYLNFTNNDIKFQKNILKKTFLRLSFYDSNQQSNQNLLHYSTIFLDSGNLFGKFTRSFLKPSTNSFYYTRLRPNDKNTIKNLEGIRVDREVHFNNEPSDIEEYRLSSQFSVKDRNSSLASSDGFYVYLWKDNDLGITPSDIYLKVEFNHAAYGRTIPLMMPFRDGGGIKTFEDIVEDWNNGGYGIRKYLKYSYIHFKYRYDKETERHIYYLDPDQYGNITLDKDNVLNINLWEAKVV